DSVKVENAKKIFRIENKKIDKCDHFFIVGEKKKRPSALGTHTSHCKHCKKNLMLHVCDVVNFYYDKYPEQKFTEKERDELYHI
ncbi:hypothetical protein OFN42_39120, partial [Escherichia coli]|nr:hypothetical protein [Escherichia coli]